jgi:hypothetical protein
MRDVPVAVAPFIVGRETSVDSGGLVTVDARVLFLPNEAEGCFYDVEARTRLYRPLLTLTALNSFFGTTD